MANLYRDNRKSIKFTPPTDKQYHYAWYLHCVLEDNADLQKMDKWQMRDYISKCLSSEENKKKIADYEREQQIRRHEYWLAREKDRRSRAPFIDDESLWGDWGLDASDFGMQGWGDS
jgi:hypothetical protein